ncbi:MAG: hypothetical protein JNN03_00895 [Rubrivivax sp.]|nr:hypothetical protein [Rubrivivax sp.]
MGPDITHNDASPLKAVVGQRIQFFGSAQGLAAGVTVASQAWTSGGIAAGRHDVTRPTLQRPQTRTNAPTVTFHWIAPRSPSRTVAVRDTTSAPWFARVFDDRASPFQKSLAFPQWTRVVKHRELGCSIRSIEAGK